LSEWAVAFAADSVVADILRQQVVNVDDTNQRLDFCWDVVSRVGVEENLSCKNLKWQKTKIIGGRLTRGVAGSLEPENSM
jgi:hypothetical protein